MAFATARVAVACAPDAADIRADSVAPADPPDRTPPRLPDLLGSLQSAARRTGGAIARTRASLARRGLRHTLLRAAQELRGAKAIGKLKLAIPENHPFRPFAVPSADAPLASIVIPVHNHFPHTLACLRALAACGDTTPMEIIVVDDASSDDTALRLNGVQGLRVVTLKENRGFIAASNAGAAIAQGQYLVFLNNDTAVQPGWLDALIGTFEAYPSAGIVGAKLVYPDGRLQEAGAIVFSDGSGWNCGRFEDPRAPAWNFVREVDYCSGAALAIARELFAQLGGFDAHYTPAYYEDTDLAMQVRAYGLRVLYQPAAVVVHYEGVSSGTDEALGAKAYQRVNRRKFATRWAQALTAQPPPNADIRIASEHRAKQHVLVIDACTPRPDHDSGSLRMFEILKLLREEGCAVSFFADNRLHDGAYTQALQALGVQVWFKPWIGSRGAWFRMHGALFDVIIASRHEVAVHYLRLSRRHARGARFVFDTVDLHFLREAREAGIVRSPALARKAQRTRALELRLVRKADLTLVVSALERDLLLCDVPAARIEVLSNIHAPVAEPAGFAARQGLLFVGSFRHPPNVDAAIWMAREVMPLIHAQRPDIELHVVGPWPPREVQILDQLPGVRVHGHVPDLRPLLDGCRIGLAPLRYGAGVKGKINQSMARGQPVVATPQAIEGMGLTDGVDVLVGADAPAIAQAVLRLNADHDLWETLSGNGLIHSQRHFSHANARDGLRRILASR
ncbi:MAG: glycosyltransferase [Proteobacteria bacterium]|nr:glycosyltransferase [Pseudomonadota bacterium]